MAGERTLTPAILTVPETGSTNADLVALVEAGSAPDGVWLRAERQTAGRGRQGRAWTSPAGNFHGSTVVALRLGDPPAPTLALVAGLAVVEAIGLPPARLKWPNDVMVDGAKLAGILLERSGEHVVIGCGINVGFAPDVPGRATSCLAAHGVVPTLDGLTGALAASMARGVAAWRDGGLVPLIAAWQAAAHPVGTPLSVALPDGTRCDGAFAGLDAGGTMMLRLADGTMRAIHAGDIFLR